MRDKSAADQRPSEDYLSRSSFKKSALSWAKASVLLPGTYTGLEILYEIDIFESLKDSFVGIYIVIGLNIDISVFFSSFAGILPCSLHFI
jgi:hypothetical protein